MNQKNNENDSSYTPFSSSPLTPPASDQNIDTVSKKSSLGDLIQFIALILIVVIPVRVFIAKPFIVNGASMDPNFATGQYLIIDQVSYYVKEPARGDVIVFKYPVDPSKYFIKRIIGLPGETVSMKNGRVTIKNKENPQGFLLDEPYLTDHSYDSMDEVLLSPGDYFVMGDNRPRSSDSRIWGPLGKGFISGRPIVRLTPLSKISLWPGTKDFESASTTPSPLKTSPLNTE